MNRISFELLNREVIMEVSEQDNGDIVITTRPKNDDKMCVTSITPQGSAQFRLNVKTAPRPDD